MAGPAGLMTWGSPLYLCPCTTRVQGRYYTRFRTEVKEKVAKKWIFGHSYRGTKVQRCKGAKVQRYRGAKVPRTNFKGKVYAGQKSELDGRSGNDSNAMNA